MGNSPEGDYLPSWYSSLSEDTGVNNNSLSPSKSSLVEDAKSIPCRVCRSIINIEEEANEYLVKCLKCHEITPIKEAPPGIKYAYCSCNCLRVVKGEIEQTKCMRPECGKTVTIPPSPVHVSKENSTVFHSFKCSYCLESFRIGTENLVGIYVKCPRCGKLSYFEEEKSSGWTSLIIYSSMFALEIVVFVILVVKIPFLIRNPVFYVVYIAAIVALLIITIYCRKGKCDFGPRDPSQESSSANIYYHRYMLI
ncbi:UNVERIFIED_CONTAM: hypothetical protein RMT77_013299 [Armadillidium vulgare]